MSSFNHLILLTHKGNHFYRSQNRESVELK